MLNIPKINKAGVDEVSVNLLVDMDDAFTNLKIRYTNVNDLITIMGVT